jgi:hypothetical protein
LTEVYVDNSQFRAANPGFYSADGRDPFLFEFCIQLQRLSIINATWTAIDSKATQPISQEKLMKMVRNHPKLRWLRSDLTDENIAMLQQERPEFTFVSK